MSDKELIRKIQRLGRKRGIKTRFEPRSGKGSHGRLYYGEKWTTTTRRGKELPPGELRGKLDQLGLTVKDLYGV